MRMMERNMSTFYYMLYLGKKEILDDWDNATGEYESIYSDPMEMRANISPSKGESQVEVFGNLTNYEKTIVISDVNCPIDENTILFIDKGVEFEDGVPKYDYTVRRVGKSLNSISYAISKVEVS